MAKHPTDPRERGEPTAPEGDAAAPRLTRRQVLISGAAAGAALGGLAVLRPPATRAESDAPPARGSYLAGVVTAVETPDTLQMRTHDGIRTVKILQGTAVHRAASMIDGKAAFTIGEEIVAEGNRADVIFVATALHTMHRVVEARVVAREGQQVRTDRGVITLTGEARPRDSFAGHALPVGQIMPGVEVAVLGRIDPRTGTLVAELISDRSHGS